MAGSYLSCFYKDEAHSQFMDLDNVPDELGNDKMRSGAAPYHWRNPSMASTASLPTPSTPR